MLPKLFFTSVSVTRTGLALLLLRVASGGLMMFHGFNKLGQFSENKDTFIDFMGLGSPTSLSLTIGAEFFCALLVLVGIVTRLSLLPLIIAMLVAVFQAHHGEITGDGEHAFLYLIAYLSLFIAGPGKYSLDALLFKEQQ